jgi:ankyrin repeat protein
MDIFEAIRDNNISFIKQYINNGKNINAKNIFLGNTPLHIACNFQTYFKTFELLVKHGADVNAKDNFGNTPLHTVLATNVILDGRCPAGKKLFFLIKHGADVNAKDNLGGTLLNNQVIACKLKAEIYELLIKKGTDVNAKDNSGRTPLNIEKCKRIIAILQKHRPKYTTYEFIFQADLFNRMNPNFRLSF